MRPLLLWVSRSQRAIHMVSESHRMGLQRHIMPNYETRLRKLDKLGHRIFWWWGAPRRFHQTMKSDAFTCCAPSHFLFTMRMQCLKA